MKFAKSLKKLVGAAGFEPATPSPPVKSNLTKSKVYGSLNRPEYNGFLRFNGVRGKGFCSGGAKTNFQTRSKCALLSRKTNFNITI